MRASVLAILLAAVLGACVPASVDEAPPPGVLFTSVEAEGYTTYRLTTEEPLDMVLLRFQGTDLRANAEECVSRAEALECSVGAVQNSYEVSVAGEVENSPARPFGVGCSDNDCHALYLTDLE